MSSLVRNHGMLKVMTNQPRPQGPGDEYMRSFLPWDFAHPRSQVFPTAWARVERTWNVIVRQLVTMVEVRRIVSCFHLVVGLLLVIFGFVDRYKDKDFPTYIHYTRYIAAPVWTGFLVSPLGIHYRCFSFKHALCSSQLNTSFQYSCNCYKSIADNRLCRNYEAFHYYISW